MRLKFTTLILAFVSSITIAVAQPNADFSWAGDPCLGQPITFTDLSTDTTGTIVTWTWDFSNGMTSNVQNPVVVYNAPGTYLVTLWVQDNNNDWDTLVSQITITQTCLQINFPENCVMVGQASQLFPDVSGGMPPYTFSGVGVSGNIFLAPSVGVYTIHVMDAVGNVASDTISVTQYGPTYAINASCGAADGIAGVDTTCLSGPSTFLWSPGGATTPEITGLVGGDYSVIVTTGGTNDTINFHVIDSCGAISGNVYFDINGNNIMDIGEPPYYYGNVTISGTQTYSTSISSSGHFSVGVTNGNVSSSFVPFSNYYGATPISHSSNITTQNPYDTVDFAVHMIPGHPDLQIYLIPFGPARPGFTAQYGLIARNVGTDTLSGYIHFVKDPRTSPVAANPAYDVLSADTIKWNFTDLAPLGTNSYTFIMQIAAPPIVNVGDSLDYSVSIQPVAGDEVPQDNYDDLRQIVIGSYDPNDKWVSDEIITPVQVADGDFLDYRIRFQNTGTDTAFTVVVRDTLSSNLDWSSLQMIYASHEYTLTARNHNELEWRFDNILLVDSMTNEPASHGYIFYRIKPKSTLVLNDNIPNSASIYFDYNLPIVTNTANTVVDNITSVVYGTIEGDISIYPNPNNGEFKVVFISGMSGTYTQELTDISGRLIYSQQFQHNGKTELSPLANLTPGVYLLNIASENSKWVKKVIVK